MFDKLRNFFKSTELQEPAPPELAQPEKKSRAKTAPKQSAKEIATAAGEPYIAIMKVDLDPDNINSGSFELDWNAKFAANLARAGYQKKPGESEDIIVDRWFQTVCRNIALEVYEQEMADPINRELDDLRQIRKRDLGNGRSEVS